MTFLALGVNHHTASVEMREKIAFNPERLAELFQKLRHTTYLNDLVVLSTCNRTEIYALTEHCDVVLQWLADVNQIDVETLTRHIYRYHDLDAMTHLIRVASGLDSLMLGEPQILGQIKTAVSLANQHQMTSSGLHRLFEYAFYAAKRVRTETAVGEHAVSMGYAVAQLAGQVFSHVSQLTVMIVATGEMNTLVAKHLAEMGVAKMIICNRTRERAELLAKEVGIRTQVEVVDFTDIAQHLHRADVVSSCTGSLHQVIEFHQVKSALKQRKYQPMLMVDLAVPRDIDAQVEELEGVYLYGIDDLQTVIDENLSQRRQAAVDAEVMVAQLAAQFAQRQKVHHAGEKIQAYRDDAEQQRQQELAWALQQLAQGQDAKQVLEQMSYRLSNKMLHLPSKLMREAAIDDDSSYAEWLNQKVQHIQTHRRKNKHK
ncbi:MULTISPECIES: glutamyl-tRNA reductase [unclassified Acinetobacter]|uniref:glutamyl-tRNA reductase n=1 Tax=unclassified Acinetobacter TaxID=196816 RepID=UPI0035BB7AE9